MANPGWTRLPDHQVLPAAEKQINVGWDAYGDPRSDLGDDFRGLKGSIDPVVLHTDELTATDARRTLKAARAMRPVKSAGIATVIAAIVAAGVGGYGATASATVSGVVFGWWLTATVRTAWNRRRTRGNAAKVLDTGVLSGCDRVLLYNLMRDVDAAVDRLRQTAGEKTAEAVRSALVADLFLAAGKMHDLRAVTDAVQDAERTGGDADLVAQAVAAQQVAYAAVGKALKAVFFTAHRIKDGAECELATEKLRALTSRLDDMRAGEVTDLHLSSTVWRQALTT